MTQKQTQNFAIVYIFTMMWLVISLGLGPSFSYANTSDTVHDLILQAQEIKKTDREKSISLLNSALERGKKIKDDNLQGQVLLQLGLMEKSSKSYHAGIDYFEKALNKFELSANKAHISEALLNIADSLRYLGEYEDATLNIMRSILVAEQIEDNAILSQAYNVLGNISKNEREYTSSVEAHTTALKYAQLAQSQVQLLQSYSNLAYAHKKIKDYDSAIYYLNQSIALIENQDQPHKLVKLYNRMAKLYGRIKNLEASKQYKLRALEIIEEIGESRGLVDGYRGLAESYSQIEDYESSLKFNSRALEVIEKSGDIGDVALILEALATDQRKLGQYSQALENFKRALTVQRELNNRERIANLLLNLSIIYRRLSSNDEALVYANELIFLQESIGDLNGMAAAYNATGLIYTHLNRTDEAGAYYEKTLALPSQKIAGKYRASAFRALAEVTQKSGNYTKSLNFAMQAAEIYEAEGSVSGAEAVNRTLGIIHQKMGADQKALASYNLALKQARELKNIWSEADSLIKIAEIKLKTDPKSAIEFARKGNEIAKRLGSKALLVEGYKVTMVGEEKLGNYERAFESSQARYELTREISRDQITLRVRELQIVRETEKKEIEIDGLKREAQIKELEFNRTSSELEILNSKNTISKMKLERERYTRIILIGITIFVVLAMALLYNRYRYSRQRQEILNEKNQQIESKNVKLEELNATKDRFFSIIAHDLRGPMSSLVSLSEMLDENFDTYGTDPLRSYIQAIRESSTQTYSLLDELLEWAMMQLRNTDPIPHKIPVNDICVSVIDTLSSIAKDKGINIVNNVQSPNVIFADRNMINTVVRNLVANALKFTPRHGRIEIFSQHHDRYTSIHVKDTGIGIAPNDLENIFCIDKNVSRDGTDGEKGTGFGLSLCKDLVNKNAGEIYVTSTVNEGSEFYIKLPNNEFSSQKESNLSLSA